MHIVTSGTKSQKLQAIREKIEKTSDPKEKAGLAREARDAREPHGQKR
jgi:hypothetical protein